MSAGGEAGDGGEGGKGEDEGVVIRCAPCAGKKGVASHVDGNEVIWTGVVQSRRCSSV